LEQLTLEGKLTELVTDLKTWQCKAQEEIKSYGAITEATKGALGVITTTVEKLQLQLDAVDKRTQGHPIAVERQKSISQQVVEHKDYLERKQMEWSGFKGQRFDFPNQSFFPELSGPAQMLLATMGIKATITNTGLGSGTAGISMPLSIEPDPLVLAQQELRIRDIIGKMTMNTGNMFMFAQQSTRTNAASPQVEAAAKAESTYAWTTASGTIKTIAHWTNVSRQALDDITWMRREIDSELRYGLLLKEEAEVLAGSGTGEHLNGIITQATAYASCTYNVSGDTKIDKLRHAKLQARLAGLATFAPDAYVLNPRDMHDIELIKTEEGGANKGLYIVGDPKTGPAVKFLWGLPVVESDSITYGTFLTGAFRTAATLIDRMLATIEISFENNDNFVKNLATILAEERIGLAVKRPTAFITGSL